MVKNHQTQLYSMKMFSVEKKKKRRNFKKKKKMYQLDHRYSSHSRVNFNNNHHYRMDGRSKKHYSDDQRRLPLYRNLADSPQNMNQESIFARLANKHKKKPVVPVVSLDDDEVTPQGVESEDVEMEATELDSTEDEIYIISDTEDGELSDIEPTAVVPDEVINTTENAPVETVQGTENNKLPSNSASYPEIIDLTDSDDESSDEVLVVKEVVSPQGDMLTAKKINLENYCEASLDTALSIGCYEDFKIHPRLWRVAQSLPVGSKSSVIRICSYNVLCQLTIGTTQHLYKHARKSPHVLLWERRWNILQEELEKIGADVFCFQEVQYDHFSAYFNPFLTSLGYGGFYKRKTGECVDGCAVFYKKSVFKSVRYSIVEYFVDENSSMDKHQIGQILRLRCIKNDQEVVIANTHILFNNLRGDIKIGQLAMLFAHIDEEMKHGAAPLILMGDFNMEANSYMYKFITESSLFLKGLPRNELSGQGKTGGPTVDADQILPRQSKVLRDSKFADGTKRDIAKDTFSHSLQLTSVYNHVNSNNLKDVSTSHVEDANPDFIFYTITRKAKHSKGCQIFEDPRLRLLKYLTLPDAKLIQETFGPWPNERVPSDHIPVIADFLLSSV